MLERLNPNLPQLDQFIEREHVQAFDEVLGLVGTLHPHVRLQRDPTLVRGLDYYNGTCFEIKLDPHQNCELLQNMEKTIFGASQNTILGGGRYDYLAKQFGWTKSDSLQAIGWAAGVNRLVMILEYMEKVAGAICIEDKNKFAKSNIIGIVSHIEKGERIEYAAKSRHICHKIK